MIRINIVSTFTADVLRNDLNNYLKQFCANEVKFFYNQIFQQTLFQNSEFSCNAQGLNVILFRLSDYISSQNIHQIKQKEDDIVHAVECLNKTMRVPLLFILTPSMSGDSDQKLMFKRFEVSIQKRILALKNTMFISYEESLNKGRLPIFNEFTEKHGHIPYTLDFYQQIALSISRTYSLFSRKPFKVIVLDCDGTLWDGIIEEQGVSGIEVDTYYQEVQQFFIDCYKKGFLLCLCSKNSEESVVDVFKQHNDMKINIDTHITTYRINWELKSQNIKDIAKELNLGLDSFIFIDDNKVECAEVNAEIPEVLAIELPKDKTERLSYLRNIWAFDVIDKKKDDTSRTQFYQTNRLRNQLKTQSVSYSQFLKKLNIKTKIVTATIDDYDRIYELSLRTNQFNVYPLSMSGVEIHQAITQGTPQVLKIEVSDKFMDYGLVGVLIYETTVEQLIIKSFFLSCRILSMGIDNQLIHHLVKICKQRNLCALNFEFIKTERNIPAINFLKKINKNNEVTGSSLTLSLSDIQEFNPLVEEEKQENSVKSSKVSSLRINHGYMLDIAHKQLMQLKMDSHHKHTNYNNDYDSIKNHLNELFIAQNIQIEQNDIPFMHFGLNSLQSVLISSEIYKIYQIEINPVDFLNNELTMDKLFSKLIEQLKHQKGSPEVESTHKLQLSNSQTRLWYDEQLMDKNSTRNTMFIAFQLAQKIQKGAFEKALAHIITKHDILRYRFYEENGMPMIAICSPEEIEFRIEYVACDDSESEALIVNQYKYHSFDLNNAPLLKVAIINPDFNAPQLLLCIHHIIHDGWSLNLLLKELTLYYGLFSAHKRVIFPTETRNRYSFSNYIHWEKKYLSDELIEKNKHFWAKYLYKLPKLELVYDYPENEMKHTSTCSRVSFTLDKKTSEQLNLLSSRNHLTLYELLCTSFGLFLSQLSNQDDIHFITAVSGRQHAQTSETMGFFVNLLLVRLHINKKSFIELAKEHKKQIAAVMAHQDISLHDIFSQAGEFVGSRNTSYHQAGFIFQNYPIHPLEFNGSSCERIHSDEDAELLYDACKECRFGNLVCFMQEFDGKLYGLFEYNNTLYNEKTIRQLIESFQSLLKQISKNSTSIAQAIPLISEKQKKVFIQQWNHEISPYPLNTNLLTQFAKMVMLYPDKTAVEAGDAHISYLELDKQSNILANKFIDAGICQERSVALFLEKGVQQIVAILAVIKTGGCYIPLDIQLPYQRMNYILKNSAVSLIVVDTHTRSHLTSYALEHLNVFELEEHIEANDQPIELPPIDIKPSNLAYILYTSGSTGNPKGVMIEHKSIMRLVQSPNYIKIDADARIAQGSQFLFDASTLEIWGALLNGATLICLPQKTLLDKQALAAFLREQRISILFLTTQLFHMYAHIAPELFADLNYLVVGGEALLADSVAHVFEQKKHPRALINGYGPTENTTFSTTYEIKNKRQITHPIPIGKPISGTVAYVLNKELNLLPVGAIGTLYLSGHGLARQYLNQDELNQEKFIHLFGERLYNTGDLVSWQYDGNIKYFGREDNQIKLNGYRVELSEIEFQLKAHPLVEQAIVLITHKNHHRYITAYVLLKDQTELKNVNLSHHLKQIVPQYMVPHVFYQVDNIPMTLNGKVDKKQLEHMCLNPITYDEFEQPQTELEVKLALIYAQTLHIVHETLNANTDFFDMGGNSISALQLIHNINVEMDLNLTFSVLYEKASIKQLSHYIEQLKTDNIDKKVSSSLAAGESSLKHIKKGSEAITPIVFIHPIGGTGFCYMDLIHLLPENQSCYLIQDPSIDAGKILFHDMSSMAAHYNKLLLSHFGEQKFILAGFSFGGMLSIEMVSQLELLKKDHLVERVIAFDTWVVSNFMNKAAKEALKKSIMNQYKQVEENLIKADIVPKAWMELYYIRLQELGFSYSPPTIDTHIILFKATHLEGEFAAMSDPANYLQLHTNKSVEIHHVEGNHNTILNIPHVHQIAAILGQHQVASH